MTKMVKKRSGELVEVHQIFLNDAGSPIALAYNPESEAWEQIRVSRLKPYKYDREQVERRLKIREAVWQTSDNQFFTNADYELAIDHELELIKQEEGEGE